MLQSLFIQNYALIEKLDIRFMSGFSVITGETGAGKSIILGAIGLLLGQRADVKSLRTGASKCIIEARFDVSAYGMQPFFAHHELEYEPECILRREVYASGKSRAFINDTPASLSQMKELGEQLIDVHSQHQNLLLNQEGFQLNFIDILAHNDHLLSLYRECYQAWKQHTRRLQELIEQAAQSKADEEFVRFQLQQLDEAALQADEQEELEQGTAELRADGFNGQIKVLTSCPSCLQGLSRYNDDGGTQADYIVVEMAKRLLGDNWMADYIKQANNGGIERVLL